MVEEIKLNFNFMSENGMTCADVAALMNNNANNGMNWNSPMWLIWALLFGNGAFGGFGRNGEALQGAEINGKLNALSNQIADNQNTNQLNSGIAGNHEFLHGLNNAMNMGFAGTNTNINNASMTNALGQKDLQSSMQSCCCENKTLAQQMGYETQLRDQTNTCAITSRIDQLANGIQTGFSNIGFLTQQQTTELNNTINSGNQRIIDTLNNHWTSDLQQKYADAKLELSQLNQNATLIAALKTTA